MNMDSEFYNVIINWGEQHFRQLYQKQEPNLKLPIPTRINNGDCFVMAVLVYLIGKSVGLKPVLHGGPCHVWVEQDGFIYDAYFPSGVTHAAIKEMQVNYMGPDEPPFYFGSPVEIVDLDGYFHNNPDRAIWIEYLINPLGLTLPTGLRRFLNRRSKYVNWNCERNAMKRFIKHLRKTNGQTGIHFRQPG